MDSQHLDENRFKFHGKTDEYFGIWIVNVLLSIATLGIYSAWAKVRNKQYFYGNSELAGERFEYLAKPLQILLGRIIAVVMVVIWAVSPMVSEILQAVLMLMFVAIMPVLVVKNLRFDSRVTRYRNVRFDFVGSYGGAYMALMVMPFLATIIFALAAGLVIGLGSVISPLVSSILGVVVIGAGCTYLYAFMATYMSRYVLNNYQWGSMKFTADIESAAMFKIFLKAAALGLGGVFALSLLGALVAFALFSADFSQLGAMFASLEQGGENLAAGGALVGIFALIYISFFLLGWFVTAYLKACLRNYQFGQTDIEGQLYMVSTVKPLAFMGVMLSNMLIIVFSFGLAIPVAKVRMAKFMAQATAVQGDIESIAINNQVSDSKTAIADEVADAFGVEIGVI
ncbi:YjgN family protein [Agarivorans aestuarii]|uniref:YjgN family protein n=1 Tax=Agarivorans aestuarii TaxID=1563703 RepID=A0ABU7G4S6_9ALTE|nr:YjgN family protein [Agarivorans aestuarii]MEE1673999.1 YjgN family protein [Agarivorans aestuarii]